MKTGHQALFFFIMNFMIIAILFVLGLCLGSFVNAWVWRVREQSKSKKPKQELSILHGRSMCPSCKHTLGAYDLVPVFSWLFLRGRCRYCRKPISVQYPAVELATASLFMLSYVFWPASWSVYQYMLLGFWLVQLVILMALAVYDLRWYLLPNRMVAALGVVVGLQILVQYVFLRSGGWVLLSSILAAAVGGGFFWILFQISDGKWIGGGDVKLGAILGLIVATPIKAFLVLFLASLLGLLIALPLLISRQAGKGTQLPFGPFLIAATIIVSLFGSQVIAAYMRLAGL